MQPLTLLHASDLHFGKPFDQGAFEAFQRFLQGASPDLVILSGDLTQRAKVREYEAAREFLRKLTPVPVVVTPGNHDVPLYRVFERLLRPLANYREYVSPELDSVTRIPGATVVALNSTAPRRTIVNGRIDDRQLLFAAEAFRESGDGEIRILVTHHNLIPAPDFEPHQVLPGFQRCLAAFEKMGVELILGGHLHRAYTGTSLDAFLQPPGTRGVPIVHSGTTTSNRGRARERGGNSLNLIRVEGERVEVVPHLLRRETSEFAPTGAISFPRARRETR